MKFGQLIDNRKMFPQKLSKNWCKVTSPKPLYFLKNLHMWWKQVACNLVQYISIALNLPYIKNKLCKTLDYWSWDMLNFNFAEKDPGLVFPPHFSSKKCLSCYIISNDQIWLSDCLYFPRYWAIWVLQLFVDQAVTSYNIWN